MEQVPLDNRCDGGEGGPGAGDDGGGGCIAKGVWAAVVCYKRGGHACGGQGLVVGSMTLMFVVSGSKNLCLSVW
jgi:hypothetical protein